MAKIIVVTGDQIKCMVMVFFLGRMERDMRESLLMTSEMALELSTGKTVESIKVSGKMGSSMGREYILVKMGSRRLESGPMGENLNGKMNE